MHISATPGAPLATWHMSTAADPRRRTPWVTSVKCWNSFMLAAQHSSCSYPNPVTSSDLVRLCVLLTWRQQGVQAGEGVCVCGVGVWVSVCGYLCICRRQVECRVQPGNEAAAGACCDWGMPQQRLAPPTCPRQRRAAGRACLDGLAVAEGAAVA